MAATVSNVWSKPGAWALDSEENEAELQQQHNEEIDKKADIKSNGGADLGDFPSLSAAVVTKTKKKKGQTISLSEFANYKSSKPVVQKGPTYVDLASLPTGPRERTAEELDRSRLGGGFRSYGGGGGGYDRNRNSDGDDSNSRWGSSRVSDDSRRQGGFGRDSNRDMAPSRADETDDWGATKKSMPSNSFDRRDRGDRGGSFFGSESKADESNSWVSNKSFVPSEGRRFEGNRERRVGFESNGGAESDNWMKKKEEEGRRFGGGGGAFDSIRERRGGFESGSLADSETWGRKREEGTVTGTVSVRPKLNLQPRTLPVNVIDNQQDVSAAPTKPKGSNPFGEARPREEVLKEKGQDWKEMEEKLESLKLKETGLGKDGSSFGKRNFGNGNSSESRAERGWWKQGRGDATPPSGEETVNENAESAGVEDDASHAED